MHLSFLLSVCAETFSSSAPGLLLFLHPISSTHTLFLWAQWTNKNAQLKYQSCCSCSYLSTSKESFHLISWVLLLLHHSQQFPLCKPPGHLKQPLSLCYRGPESWCKKPSHPYAVSKFLCYLLVGSCYISFLPSSLNTPFIYSSLPFPYSSARPQLRQYIPFPPFFFT